MKFRVEEDDGTPVAVFEDEQPPRSWLLASLLEEARPDVQMFIDELERARSGEAEPTGYSCNSVAVDFYRDRAVIEELYPAAGEDAEPERVELTLDEARQLLRDWQVALERWRPPHSG